MIGEIVSGRYRIVSRIGSGGAGDVYLAEDTDLPRRIALKFLSTAWEEDRHQRERFLRETEALSALDHPHICTIYEAGETDSGHLYIAMAYYEGENLRNRLAHGAFAPAEAVSCAIAIADGMDKAHRKGFLHRDLKPGNVVITEDGVVKILDFGLVKSPDRTQLTETGVTMGTLAYASPEQIRGEKLDARSDIYSLGVMLYQMLTGKCPFTAPGAAATIAMVLNEVPESLAISHPDLPAPLAELVDRCISKKRRHRPETMAEVHDVLIEVLADLSPTSAARLRAEHVEHVDHPRAPVRPRRRLVVAATILIAVIATVWWFGREDHVDDPGIAVIGIEAAGDAALATGLSEELAAQAVRIAALRPGRWVLPPTSLGTTTMDEAGPRLGLEHLLTGSIEPGPDRASLLLATRDARSLDVTLSNEWSLPDSQQAAPDLAPWLARILDLELTPAELASVRSPSPATLGTWLDYLRGLGLSESAPDSAAALLRAVLERDRGFAPARLALARALVAGLELDGEEDRVQEIEGILDELGDEPSIEGEVYALRARLSAVRQDTKSIAEFYRLAAIHLPSNPVYRTMQWLPWFYDGASETAEAICREAVEEHPGYTGSHYNLGWILMQTGQSGEAIEEFRKAARLAPADHRTHINMGAIYYDLEDWDAAIDAFEKSYEIRRRNYPAISNLGALYYITGQFEKSADMQELALEYDPDGHTVMGNYASALRWIPGREDDYHQSLARARELVEAELEDNPDDPGRLSFLASYCVDVDTARALEIGTKAARLAPDDHEVVYRVAVLHEELGRRARALALLGTAIELGHSMREIEAEPLLESLRTDPRYALLTQ